MLNMFKFENKNFQLIISSIFAILAICALCFVFTIAINDVSATDYYVSMDGNDSKKGTSESDAYLTVNKAVESANGDSGNNKITIGPGEYTTEKNRNMVISRNVSIYGASYFNSSKGATILNAEGGGRFFTVDNNVAVNFYNIAFINGNIVGRGGAIYTNGGTIIANGCNFTSNTATIGGGAIYATGGTTGVNGCNFVINVAEGNGGAIYTFGSVISVNACNFTFNMATTNNSGAIYSINNDVVNVNDCNFNSNMAAGAGGGAVYVYNGGVVSVSGCNFISNVAIHEGNGGAVYVYTGNIIGVNGCNFTSNSANWGGAVFIHNGNVVSVNGSNFISNRVTSGGGAVYVHNGGSVTVSACNFTSNSANWGGAIYNDGGVVSVSGSNFNYNEAIDRGGAVFVYNGGVVSVNTCNFDFNTAINNGGAIYGYGSLLVDGSCFVNNIATSGSAIYARGTDRINIRYNSFVNNNGKYQFYNSATGSVIANYNWWGSNNVKLATNAVLNNYYVMKISTVANYIKDIGDNLPISYSFVLNGTNNNAGASSKFMYFTVPISANAKIWKTIDGRESVTYGYVLTALSTSFSAKLNNQVSSFVYKGGKEKVNLFLTSFKALYKKSNTIKITFKDSIGKTVAGKVVKFYVNGKLIKSVKTDKKGLASFKYTFNTRKAYKIVAKFVGDSSYLAANSATLKVVPKDKTYTSLAKFTAKYNKKATLKATLKNVAKKVMKGKYIKFYAKNKYIGKAKTNSKGLATLTKKITLKGLVNFIAKYAGDKNKHSSSYARKLTIK